MKRFVYFFVWTLAIGLVLYFGMQLQDIIEERTEMTYVIFPLILYTTLFPVILGLLLGTPKLILKVKKDGFWHFDWIKFIAVGLPSLFIVLMNFLPFSPLGEGWLVIPEIILIGGTTVPTVAGLVFGYILLDSFKKNRKNFRSVSES